MIRWVKNVIYSFSVWGEVHSLCYTAIADQLQTSFTVSSRQAFAKKVNYSKCLCIFDELLDIRVVVYSTLLPLAAKEIL